MSILKVLNDNGCSNIFDGLVNFNANLRRISNTFYPANSDLTDEAVRSIVKKNLSRIDNLLASGNFDSEPPKLTLDSKFSVSQLPDHDDIDWDDLKSITHNYFGSNFSQRPPWFIRRSERDSSAHHTVASKDAFRDCKSMGGSVSDTFLQHLLKGDSLYAKVPLNLDYDLRSLAPERTLKGKSRNIGCVSGLAFADKKYGFYAKIDFRIYRTPLNADGYNVVGNPLNIDRAVDLTSHLGLYIDYLNEIKDVSKDYDVKQSLKLLELFKSGHPIFRTPFNDLLSPQHGNYWVSRDDLLIKNCLTRSTLTCNVIIGTRRKGKYKESAFKFEQELTGAKKLSANHASSASSISNVISKARPDIRKAENVVHKCFRTPLTTRFSSSNLDTDGSPIFVSSTVSEIVRNICVESNSKISCALFIGPCTISKNGVFKYEKYDEPGKELYLAFYAKDFKSRDFYIAVKEDFSEYLAATPYGASHKIIGWDVFQSYAPKEELVEIRSGFDGYSDRLADSNTVDLLDRTQLSISDIELLNEVLVRNI